MKKSLGISFSHLTRLFLIMTIGLGAAAFADDDSDSDSDRRVLRYDVAQDLSTFLVVSPDGAPDFSFAAGSPFSVKGYIYPAGTLQGGTVTGVNPDGSPTFPNRVLGRWSCRGWFIEDGAFPEGIQLVGTQVWIFGPLDEKRGRKTLITDGIDLTANPPDLNFKFKRAITGGTGRFSGASGQQITRNFGFNADFTGFGATHTLIIESGDD